MAYRLVPGRTLAFALFRGRHAWLVAPGAPDVGARLRAWEYEGGALARKP